MIENETWRDFQDIYEIFLYVNNQMTLANDP